MKTLKKALAIFLCITTILSIASLGANAGGDMYDNWGVTWNGVDEEFEIIDIDFVTETELIIPETINNWPVVGFKFNEYDTFETVETLILPKTFEKSWFEYPFSHTFPNLKEIIVDENNPYFSSLDGVLYSKDLSILYVYPCNKENTTFETPDDTHEISFRALEGCQNLKTLVLGKGIISIFTDYSGKEPYSLFTSIEKFEVNESNEYYTAVDGVLYSSDKKTLIKYPDANLEERFTIPEGTDTIGHYSFGYCKNIKELYIASTVKNIEQYAFSNSGLQFIGFYGCELDYIGTNILAGTPIYDNDENWDTNNGLFYYNNFLLNANYTNGAKIKIKPGTTHIAASVFDMNDYIYLLSIPSTIKSINSSAITVRVTNICYGDYEENWDNIDIGRYNYFYAFGMNSAIDFEDAAVFHYECENANIENNNICAPSFLTRIMAFFKILFNLF